MHELDPLFHPRSVAIVGISSAAPAGGIVFGSAMLELGFGGPIYLVHPTADAIRGLKCYPSVRDIPGPVDYVILAVPPQRLAPALDDCIAKGVRWIHLFSAGFSESGDAVTAQIEADIVLRARAAGIRMIGPNCMGLYVPGTGLAQTAGQCPEPGPVGMVAQSGWNAMEAVRHGVPRGLRFSKVASIGNAADLTPADFLDYFTADEQTRIILMYLEDTQDGRRLAAAMRRAAASKPLLVLKGGRTDAGSRAAASHTAALAGMRAVFDGLCRQAGAVLVDNLEELVDTAVAFRFAGGLAGPNVFCWGAGGGLSVVAADELEGVGLKVPELPAEAQEILRPVAGGVGKSVVNPVDTAAEVADADAFLRLALAGTCAANIHGALYHTSFKRLPARSPRLDRTLVAEALRRAQLEAGKPIAVATIPPFDRESYEQGEQFLTACAEAGLAAFPSITRAARALAHICAWRRSWDARGTPPPLPSFAGDGVPL